MDRIQNVHDKFLDGYACSQAIATEYCGDFGLDPEIALRLSSPFAAGMRKAKVCGAVTGALMIIGLKFGGNQSEKFEGRQKVYEAAVKFTDRFKEMNGSIECRELLSVDISTTFGHEIAKEKDLFRNTCPKFIKDSAFLLEEIIKEG